MQTKLSSNRKIKNATKTEVDGINLDSKLEAYMYKLLRDKKINFEMQKVFELQPAFRHGKDAVRRIDIKVDFFLPDHNLVIDTKGWQLSDNKIKVKMLKYLWVKEGLPYTIELPSSQKECIALYYSRLHKAV